MDDLAEFLALEARKLNLDALNVAEANPDSLRTFAQSVLEELAARGLVKGEAEVGCWASLRSAAN